MGEFPNFRTKQILLLGLGNPSLGDDGIGWRVVESLAGSMESYHPEVECDCLAVGGIRLMERLEGYERAILVDAFQASGEPTGSVQLRTVEDLPSQHSGDVHSASLLDAIATGSALGVKLPERIEIVGITIQPVFEFSEQLSKPVARAIPAAIKLINQLLAG